MDYKEALAYMAEVASLGSKPGLERITELLEKLGNPQDRLKYVHIAGTNGKGSCAAMMASVLKAAGYRTGLYTSPYLFRFNERMQINGEQIEDEEVAALVDRLKPLADAMENKPTEFEMMTAAAFLWFAEKECDIVVLEVGLGGRFDATNVIKAPEVAVIMNIGLDHTAILGDTVEQIAWEKAGILKPGCSCVLYQQQESVQAVIAAECEKLGAALHVADFGAIQCEFNVLEGQVFTYKQDPYAIALLGEHQQKNAAVVIEAAQVLRSRGWQIEQDQLEHGLYATAWPARFEVLSDDPYFVVDGGHNPQCAETVVANLKTYFPDQHRVILIGVLADKDYPELTKILNEAADEYICVTPDSPRALSAEALAEHLKAYGKPVLACADVPEAVHAAALAAGETGMVCAVGSLYMAGAIRACFNLYR